MRTLLGTGLLLLTLTACGAGNTAAPAAPGSTGPETPTTSSASPPPSSPPVAAPPSQTVGRPTQGIVAGDNAIAEAQIDAKGLPEGFPRTLVRSMDGKTLTLQAEDGGCRHVSAHVGDQTPEQVSVLIAVSTAKKGQMCPDYIKNVSIPLPLAAPLGSRTVVLRQG